MARLIDVISSTLLRLAQRCFISVKDELAINTQQATLITTSISIAKIFGAFFAGWLVYKLGIRKGYFVGCLFISSGIFLSVADSYMAIFWSLNYIVVNINNEIIAFSVDKTGSFTFGFTYMFVLMAIFVPLSLWVLPERHFFTQE